MPPPYPLIDISTVFKGAIIKMLQYVFLDRFQDYLKGTYGSADSVINRFSGGDPRVRLIFDDVHIDIEMAGNEFEVKVFGINKIIKARRIKSSRFPKQETDKLIIYYYSKYSGGFKDHFIDISADYCAKMLGEVLNGIHTIHYLPASRSGLYTALSAFGQIIAELAKSRSFLKGRIELPGIAVPLSDYFLDLSQITPNEKPDKDNPIQRIANDIENDILKGKVEFDKKTRKLFYTPDGTQGLRLDIDATSSMVSELAPIVSFVRHIVAKSAEKTRDIREAVAGLPREEDTPQKKIFPKPLLFIEEPEAHLHPENQVKLMAAFAALANAGVKVIITSHSSTLFHKLNNLILGKHIDTGIISATLFQQTEKGSNAVPLPLDELGIEDDNFIDTTEGLYDEKVDLIDRMNRSGDDGDAG